MKTNLTALASLVLASAFAANAQAPATAGTEHKPVRKTKHVVRKPTVQKQMDELREQMAEQQQAQQAQNAQITALQQQLASSQAQLSQAQQQAQNAIEQAQSALQTQQAATTQNTQAVGSLQTAVSDLTTNTQSMASTMQADQVATKKAIENPDQIHFKGVGLSFTNSFIEFATVDRTRATGSDIPTPFTSIPFIGADEGHLSEFYATGRQSRLAMSFTGRIPSATLQAYYEADWLGTGITSNNNQSNSYVLRERQLWAQAALNSGLTFTGGQQWSLATETRNGLDNKTEVLPDTIDPNYNVGFVWERQPGLRITKDFGNKLWLGVSAEQSQTLNPSCVSTATTSTTTAGVTTTTSVGCPSNYVIGSVGTGGGLYNATANYSANLAPDLIAKMAFQTPSTHVELWGVSRFFRNRVYPNAISPATGAGGVGAYNDSTVGGGVGGGIRQYVANKRFELALHGLYGDGMGRYASAQLPDLTVRPSGQLALLHNSAALGEVFAHVTPRLDMYADWGYEEAGRRIFAYGNSFEGYGLHTQNDTGCYTEINPVGSTSNAYPPQTTGLLPGTPANCGGSNKDVTEGTAGYDYYFYKGPMGRFRQGIQYSWVERALWSGSTGTSPKAIDNVIETNIRYYLP
jgi:hypothetical protein